MLFKHNYIARGELIMYKLVLKKGNNYIKSEADWFKYVPPKKNNHWRHEVTIKMLAEYFIAAKGYIPKEIEDILINIQCKNDKPFFAEPEAVTIFDTKGVGLHHDLLLVKKNDIVIGIEAKVDEKFGGKVLSILSKDISDNLRERIGQFNKELYGGNMEQMPNVSYQLLEASSGILIESRKAKANKAILLICTFVNGNNANVKKIIKNIDDIYQFKSSLEKYSKNGFYNLPSYGDIDFYIKHIEV